MFSWHHLLSEDFIMHLFTHYGYSVIFITVTLESMGLPLPAESLLAASALLCATTHHLYVGYIALCGIVGAIIGDNLGFLFGEYIGMPLVHKYGPRFGLTQKRQAIAEYIFYQHGGSVVFFGRFISFLRMFVSILAGAGGMQHRIFLFYNVLSAFVWGSVYTLIPYYLGSKIEHLTYGIAISVIVIMVLVIAGLFMLWRKKEASIEQKMLTRSRSPEEITAQENEASFDNTKDPSKDRP